MKFQCRSEAFPTDGRTGPGPGPKLSDPTNSELGSGHPDRCQIEVFQPQLFSADGRHAARSLTPRFDILLPAVIPNLNQNPSLVALGKLTATNPRATQSGVVTRSDGRTDRRMDRRTDGRTDGRMDGRTNGRTDGSTDRWTDGRTDLLKSMDFLLSLLIFY